MDMESSQQVEEGFSLIELPRINVLFIDVDDICL